MASGIIPVYLISISPPEISGIVGSFNQLLITLGIATAYGLGYLPIYLGCSIGHGNNIYSFQPYFV